MVTGRYRTLHDPGNGHAIHADAPSVLPKPTAVAAPLLPVVVSASGAWNRGRLAGALRPADCRSRQTDWESGAITPALEALDQGIEANPDAVTLHKLRGDILATSRASQQALQAYDTVLGRQPTALDVRWAKWSLLVRSGYGDESIEELRRIALIDTQNPLIHFRLARELRKLDRLEASLESYKQAVALAPEMHAWRLALARARFDVLDYEGASNDVQYVLDRIPPGSPLELPAHTLVTVFHGHSQDRGRRFDPVFTPKDITPDQLKQWALMRADAWRSFVAGRYREAEPMYRKLLELNPRDPSATHQFGLTLMQLDKCEEALPVFGKVSDLDPTEDQYADIVFRMGQCLVELEGGKRRTCTFTRFTRRPCCSSFRTRTTRFPRASACWTRTRSCVGWRRSARTSPPKWPLWRLDSSQNRLHLRPARILTQARPDTKWKKC